MSRLKNALKYTGCRSCFACKVLGGKSFAKCAVRDDLEGVLQKILSADALFVAAPIYFGQVPGMVRSFYERLWFPSLLYRADGKTAYPHTLKTGLIYTMNSPDANFYRATINEDSNAFRFLVGDTKVLTACDTLQFSDYSKYSSSMFDAEHKKAVHETQFPKDLERARQFGISLIKE